MAKNTVVRIILLPLFVTLFLSHQLRAGSSIDGHYGWDNEGHEEEYGGVHQIVDITVEDLSPDTISVSGTIFWHEGCIVEFGAAVPRSGMVAKVQPDGSTKYEVLISFKDNWDNDCKGTLIVAGRVAVIDLEVINVVEPRGARQYGEYTLSKQ